MRLEARRRLSAARVARLKAWLDWAVQALSTSSPEYPAVTYMLERWPAFERFLTDGRAELSNNAVERAIRPVVLGRRNYSFMGSDAGGERAAVLYTLLQSAKLNGVDPEAWLTDVLTRIADFHAPLGRKVASSVDQGPGIAEVLLERGMARSETGKDPAPATAPRRPR